jgi:hypothetical protein
MTCDNCENYKPRPEPDIDPELVCRAIDAGEKVRLELSGWSWLPPVTIVAVRYQRYDDGVILFHDNDYEGARYVGRCYRRILSAVRVDCVDRATIRDEDTVTMIPSDVSDMTVFNGRWLVGKTVDGYVVTKHVPAPRKVTAYKVVKAWPGVVMGRCLFLVGNAWVSTGPSVIELTDAMAVQAVRDGYLEAVYE